MHGVNHEKHVRKKLSAMDLEPILFLLTSLEDGPQWTLQQARSAEQWYRRFHRLIHQYPSHAIVPTKAIDEFWHLHIMDTQKYANDCLYLHGHFVHHFPYFGVRGPRDRADLIDTFRQTMQLFEHEYGESPEQIEALFGRDTQDASVICGKCKSPPDATHFDKRPQLPHDVETLLDAI
ncbi:glycine-rich domain-containing protein [Bradyrhizobium betae]|uniref:glycine-rich domain-containing protein n=1 Tax=Bradyrhizobium betae TaxID=244734 RepID=UPI003D674F65